MYYKVLPLLLTVVVGNPIYVETQTPLEQAYPGVNLHHLSQGASLISQQLGMLYPFGNFDQTGTLSKSLLTSALAAQKAKGLQLPIVHPATLALASPLSFPLKKEMEFPEKSIAGALIKQVPKISALPISVAYPKLELASLAQSGILESGLAGASVLAGKSLINSLGFPYSL